MAQTETRPAAVVEPEEKLLPNGMAAATLLAAGIGCLTLGIITTAAAASAAFANSLKFVTVVGPLSGKTTIAIVVWLISWLVLHFIWRKKEVAFTMIFVVALILVGLGLLGTFPSFYDLFAG